MSLDEIFFKEFKEMSQQRVAISGALSLYDLPLPKYFTGKVDIHKRVFLAGIRDEYYSKLNKSEPIYWTKPNLRRRKFGAGGVFLKDRNGNIVTEQVTLPQSCIAVASDRSIRVPLKHVSEEGFEYVDCLSRKKNDGTVERLFIYIIPKKYCYLVNQLALVLSLNKLRNFYYGQEMVLQSGHTVYLYVIPFKSSSVDRPYRILMTKTVNNFSQEIDGIMKFWLNAKILYPVELTALSEPVRDTYNVAYRVLSDTQAEFVRFDPNKSLADDSEEL